ncbi:MAG: NAD(P)-dependent oxidoreductase [Micropruina sp.]|uniref:NAD-dependent epimerase/dehydratase family protein n=1 Tax=Micropruina sp. TaxID=2737536 RepID=UPI0039E68836
MRIFVAGGSGVLGRNAIPLLAGAGHQVVATTRSAGKTGLLAELGASPVVLDALDRDGVLDAVECAQPDAILHLLTDLGSGDRASTTQLRIVGTRHLVEAAQRSGVERMVAESISWVCRPGREPAGENDPLDLEAPEPRRAVVRSIQSLEAAVQEIPAGVVLRFGYLYGPGTWYSRQDLFGRQAQQGQLPATETVASFIHVGDAARAAVAALDWDAGIWNVVDDDPAAGHDWVPAFAAAVGAPSPASVSCGDIGRPVSNAQARRAGLRLDHPSWRTGFLTL